MIGGTPKVRDCLWRICRDVLPTKVNLFAKKIIQDKWCIMCGRDLETNWHIFFNCCYALEIWEAAGLSRMIESVILQVDITKDLIFKVIADVNSKIAQSFGIILWQIWKQRNLKLWENKFDTPSRALFLADTLCADFDAAHHKEHNQHLISRCDNWHKPPMDTLKVNVDAALFEDSIEMGLGMVLRDGNGQFLAARTIMVPGLLSVDIGEAMGFMEALSWIKEMRSGKTIIEGDAKIVIDAINSNDISRSSFGDYIEMCKSIIRETPNYSIAFVRRNVNSMTHAFARVVQSVSSLVIGLIRQTLW